MASFVGVITLPNASSLQISLSCGVRGRYYLERIPYLTLLLNMIPYLTLEIFDFPI